jgi:cell division protein FtsQ
MRAAVIDAPRQRFRTRALPRALRLLLALVIGALVLFGGWMWLRESSLVAITKVTIRGAAGPQALEAEAALRAAAREQTTLALDASRLRAAVRAFPEVSALRVHTSFPHGLTIDVVEKAPVAALVYDGERVGVRADGTLLGSSAAASLPSVALAGAPPLSGRLNDPAALAAVAVLAGAPYALRPRITDAIPDPRGVRVEMRAGPELVFGPAQQIAAKWAAAVRVLADPAAAGAIYIDLRLPDRPAAGGRGSESGPTATSLDPGALTNNSLSTGSGSSTAAGGSVGSGPSTGATGSSGGAASTGSSGSSGTSTTGVTGG